MTEKAEPWFSGFGWFITILGVSGNAFVIYLIATKHHLQKKANWFILSLATADLFVGLSYIPPFYACRKMEYCTQEVWLVTRQTIMWLFLYSSVTNLFVMTVDRYVAVTLPLKHKRVMTPGCIVFGFYSLGDTDNNSRAHIYTDIPKQQRDGLKVSCPSIFVHFRVGSLRRASLFYISHGLRC